MSFDSLSCEHKSIFANEFIKTNLFKIFDDSLVNRQSGKSKMEFIDEQMDVNYLPDFVIKQIEEGQLLVKKVNITRNAKYPDGATIVALEFVKAKSGYKFYGYDKFGQSLFERANTANGSQTINDSLFSHLSQAK